MVWVSASGIFAIRERLLKLFIQRAALINLIVNFFF